MKLRTFGMPPLSWAVLACVIMVSCAGSLADAVQPSGPQLVYRSPFAAQPPTLDGDVSEACWSGAMWAVIQPRPDAPSDRGDAQVRLVWDDVYLYFAAQVRDATPMARHVGRDSQVWNDDCVELYLSPAGNGDTYYELDFNSRGEIWDSMGLTLPHGHQLIPAWNPASLEVRTRVADGGWTLEGRVRWDDLAGARRNPPRHGDRFPMNLYYLDASPTRPALPMAWNPTDDFKDLSRFGELLLADDARFAKAEQARIRADRILRQEGLQSWLPLQPIQVRSDTGAALTQQGQALDWRAEFGFGRVVALTAPELPFPCWQMQPAGNSDATVVTISAPGDGVWIVLARLNPRSSKAINEQAGGDGVWLTQRANEAHHTLRLLDDQWQAVSVPVRAYQVLELRIAAGPSGNLNYDRAEVAMLLAPAQAIHPPLPNDWAAFGAQGMVSHEAGVLHVHATDHFTGAVQRIPITQGGRLYRLTGAIRSRLLGTTRAHVGIDYLDIDGKFIRQAVTRAPLDVHLRWGLHNVSGLNDWSRFLAHAHDPPPEAAFLSLWVGVNAWEEPDAAGEAWFKDLKVEAIEPQEGYPLGFPPLQWQPPSQATLSSDKPFLLSVTPWTRQQLQNMPPLPDSPREVRAQAWPGASVAASFTVYPQRDIRNLRVRVSDLRSNQHTLPASHFDVKQVRHLYRKRHLMSHEYLLAPTYLEPVAELSLAAGANAQIWLTLRTSADVAPGRYEGQVHVTGDGADEQTLPIVLDVAAIQPSPVQHVSMGVYSYYLPKDSPQVLRAALADMRAHGMNTTFLFNSNLRIPIDTTGDRAIIQWESSNQLRELMEAYGQAGFSEPLLLLAPHAFYDAAAKLSGNGTHSGPRFASVYRDLFSQLAEQARQRQWPAFIIAPYDEGYPYPFADTRFELTRAMLPPTREAGLSIAVHSLNHPMGAAWRFEQEFQPLIDVVLQTFCHPPGLGPEGYRGYRSWTQYRDAMHAMNKRVVFYNPDCTGANPEAMRFVYGIGLWKLRADGMITWHYFESQRDGGYGLSQKQGQAVLNLVYPPTDQHAGGPTIAWEAVREGVYDYQLLATWHQLAQAAAQSDDSSRRQRALDSHQAIGAIIDRVRFDRIDPVGALALPNRWERETIDENPHRHLLHGEYKLDNGLTLVDYDNLRRLLCEAIAHLQHKEPSP